ncbi:MAG: bacteriophage abortive infection AbiH family protein [Muribaculaceae bacterium]|nr:bacteriophage abortive infection AbiH family protein [Muribaculaceae bacterium]
MRTPKTLYIIGNGFDLSHGIPSGYPEFKTFCERTERYVPLFNQINECLTVLDSGWNNFEEALGRQDISALKKYIDRNHRLN